jgi:hypothetical protein
MCVCEQFFGHDRPFYAHRHGVPDLDLPRSHINNQVANRSPVYPVTDVTTQHGPNSINAYFATIAISNILCSDYLYF